MNKENELTLLYKNDGKEKCQSAEISLDDSNFSHYTEDGTYIISTDISDITGYGFTFREAYDDFKNKFNLLLERLIVLKDEIEKEEIKILDEYGQERKFIDLSEDK